MWSETKLSVSDRPAASLLSPGWAQAGLLNGWFGTTLGLRLGFRAERELLLSTINRTNYFVVLCGLQQVWKTSEFFCWGCSTTVACNPLEHHDCLSTSTNQLRAVSHSFFFVGHQAIFFVFFRNFAIWSRKGKQTIKEIVLVLFSSWHHSQ